MFFSPSQWFSHTESLVAVDISQSSIKALKMSWQEGRWHIEHMGRLALAEDVFDGFVVRDETLLATSIRELFSNLSIKDTRVAIALPDNSVISKMIQVSQGLEDNEIEELIQLEAEKYVPIALDDLCFDFQTVPGESRSDLSNVWLVATRKENIDSRVRAFEMAQLEVKVVELESNVLLKALSYLKLTDQNIMVLDVGAYSTKQYVFEHGRLIYMNEDEFGGRQLTYLAASFYDMTPESFLKLMSSQQLPQDFDQEIYQPFLKSSTQQILRMIDNFIATKKVDSLDGVYLLGGTSGLVGLLEALQHQVLSSDKSDLAIDLLNPFSQTQVVDQDIQPYRHHQLSVWAGLFGLAIRPYQIPGLLKLS